MEVKAARIIKNTRRDEKKREQIKKLYVEEKLTMQEIGETFSPPITRQRVQMILSELGIRGDRTRKKKNPELIAQEEKILRLAVGSSKNIPEIAEEVGVPPYRVQKTINKNNIKRNTRTQKSRERYWDIYQLLLANNSSYREIAEKFGVSLHTVCRAAKLFNYKRDYGERKGHFGTNNSEAGK